MAGVVQGLRELSLRAVCKPRVGKPPLSDDIFRNHYLFIPSKNQWCTKLSHFSIITKCACVCALSCASIADDDRKNYSLRNQISRFPPLLPKFFFFMWNRTKSMNRIQNYKTCNHYFFHSSPSYRLKFEICYLSIWRHSFQFLQFCKEKKNFK